MPESDEDDGLIPLGSKEREPNVPGHACFDQAGNERVPGQAPPTLPQAIASIASSLS